METTKNISKALRLDLDRALEDQNEIAADLNEAILSAAIAMNDYQMAKTRYELIEAKAMIDPDITGPFTNDTQRKAAVKVFMATDLDAIDVLNLIYQTYQIKADAEGRVERIRAILSSCKRKSEMLVAVARMAGAE